MAVLPLTTTSVPVLIERSGSQEVLSLRVQIPEATGTEAAAPPLGDCPHPAPVCLMRQAVFPVSSFDPIASATRIGPDLLVTNRHVVGDKSDAVVHTPSGPLAARVIPSSYKGDLVLLEVQGLPDGAHIPELAAGNIASPTSAYFAVGADVVRQEVRVFAPGDLIALPAPGAEFGRVHVTARMQPGVSGGALVNQDGDLVGVAVGGGEGRFEAISLSDLRAALEGPSALTTLAEICAEAMNLGQLLEAGRALARAGQFDAAAAVLEQAVAQVPNSINGRKSLLVALQLGARFPEMTDHARRLMKMAPDDPGVLRFGIQSGVWGDAPELAEEAYQLLLEADPRQAEAARRFIDGAPPAPPRRN